MFQLLHSLHIICYCRFMRDTKNKISIGNLDQDKDKYRGWVVGHFIDNTSPLCTSDLEIKWSRHRKGDKKETIATNQTAKTLFILISGKFKFKFPNSDQKEVVIEREADYVFYDAGVPHAWEVLEDCLAINIRWPSVPNDQDEK